MTMSLDNVIINFCFSFAIFSVTPIVQLAQKNFAQKSFALTVFFALSVFYAKKIFEFFSRVFPMFLMIFRADFSISYNNFAILIAKMTENRKINSKYEQNRTYHGFEIRFYTCIKKFSTRVLR